MTLHLVPRPEGLGVPRWEPTPIHIEREGVGPWISLVYCSPSSGNTGLHFVKAFELEHEDHWWYGAMEHPVAITKCGMRRRFPDLTDTPMNVLMAPRLLAPCDGEQREIVVGELEAGGEVDWNYGLDAVSESVARTLPAEAVHQFEAPPLCGRCAGPKRNKPHPTIEADFDALARYMGSEE